MPGPLPNPDVTIQRTRLTRRGEPVRCFNLCTVAAEDWCVKNLRAGEFRQIGRGLVVAKRETPTLAGRMSSSGLIVRELLGADLASVPDRDGEPTL